MKVEFVCERDPNVAEYCRQVFEAQFNKMLASEELPPSTTLRKMATILRQEARRQEWYDFTTDENGCRQVIRDGNRARPQLLVPVIRIVA